MEAYNQVDDYQIKVDRWVCTNTKGYMAGMTPLHISLVARQREHVFCSQGHHLPQVKDKLLQILAMQYVPCQIVLWSIVNRELKHDINMVKDKPPKLEGVF